VSEAHRPIMLVGGSDYAPHERDALLRWAQAMACPVLTSPSALGLVPDGFEWLGGAFLNGLLERPMLERSDLLVTVNLNANDFFNAPWPVSANVVSIRRDPDTQRFVPRAREVIGDAGPVFTDLLSLGPTCRSEWVTADVIAHRARIREQLASPADRLTVVSGLEVVAAALPDDTLVAVDAGFAKPITAYLWRPGAPGAYFASHGLSTMGYAIPAANALKLAHPERTVLGLLGDGSLLMRATEIRSAVELGIAPMYLVWMDGSLTQIEMKQRLAGLRTVGAAISAPACAELAQALGACGADVSTLAELRRALAEAQHSRLPTLIGAHIDTSRHADWYGLIRG
jgi:acetolactate synthase I/II/III large subunit